MIHRHTCFPFLNIDTILIRLSNPRNTTVNSKKWDDNYTYESNCTGYMPLSLISVEVYDYSPSSAHPSQSPMCVSCRVDQLKKTQKKTSTTPSCSGNRRRVVRYNDESSFNLDNDFEMNQVSIKHGPT